MRAHTGATDVPVGIAGKGRLCGGAGTRLRPPPPGSQAGTTRDRHLRESERKQKRHTKEAELHNPIVAERDGTTQDSIPA